MVRPPVLLVLAACALLGSCASPGTPVHIYDIKYLSGLTPSNLQPSTTDTTTVSFTLFNTSNQNYPSVTWTVFEDSPANAPTGGSVYATGTVPLGPYATLAQSFTIPPTAAGTHIFTAVIDPNHQLTQDDPTDNISVLALTFADYNLVFNGPPITTPATPVTTGFSIVFNIENIDTSGNLETVNAVPWEILEDGLVVTSGTTGAVGPNATIQVTSPQITPAAGDHYYEIVIDPAETIVETSKADNAIFFNVPVTVPSADG